MAPFSRGARLSPRPLPSPDKRTRAFPPPPRLSVSPPGGLHPFPLPPRALFRSPAAARSRFPTGDDGRGAVGVGKARNGCYVRVEEEKTTAKTRLAVFLLLLQSFFIVTRLVPYAADLDTLGAVVGVDSFSGRPPVRSVRSGSN